MNRRRIGLAALVSGAGAVVRRRLQRQTDPGTTPANESAGSVEPVELAATDAAHAVGNANTNTVQSDSGQAAGETTVDSPVAGVVTGHGEVSLGSPSIDVPTADTVSSWANPQPVTDAELGDPEIRLTSGEAGAGSQGGTIETPSIRTPYAQPPKALSGYESAVAPEVESGSASVADGRPAISLPTMPQAGTNDMAPSRAEPVASTNNMANEPRITDPATSAIPTDGQELSSLVASNTTGAPDTTGASNISPPRPPPPPRPASDIPLPPPGAGRRWGGWSIAGSVVGALIVLAIIAASFVRLPYYALEPGSVYDTIERVRAPGDLVSIPSGEIGFVTVSQTANISPWKWLDAKLDGNIRIRHEDEVRGDQTADELREADIRRMQVSKDAAVVVALQKLGFDLMSTPIGIEVAHVFPCTAADGVLGTGDLIVGVDGADVRDGEQLVAALTSVGIGQDVELLVERIDPSNPTQSMHTEPVNVTLGSADDACLPDDVRADEPRAFIGIGTMTLVDEEFPIDVDIRTGSVSGPSAGLAFTLAIIDVLSEGELTNGLNVVATGTIDRDGNVGPVGGIQQKTIAAERSGADVLIVPACCDNFVDRETGEPLDLPTNYDEAVEYAADDLIVIGVNTLDEALEAIGELGGDVERFLG